MKKITFECETITPMFLSGADGKTPELRAPSIKAAIRFWWRALNSNKAISELRKEEAKIFGGSGENEGKSRFNIKVLSEITNENVKATLRNIIWDDNRNSIKNSYEGMGYLLYSTVMQKDNLKPYFNDISFSVILSSSSSEVLKEVSKSFLLFSIFGALGSRSRRGAGNFYIKKIIGNESILENNFILNSKNKEDLKIKLENLLKSIYKKGTIKSAYSNLSNIRIFIFDPMETYEKCFELIGVNYKNFRNRRNPDYDTIKNYLQTGSLTRFVEKSEFGLPISYKYRSLNGKSALIQGSSNDRQRSSSPLIFRILKTKNSDKVYYFPIILVFFRELFPPSDSINISEVTRSSAKKSPVEISIPNNSKNILNDYINQLPNNKVEVKL